MGGGSLRNRTQCLAIVTQRGELYLPSDDDNDDDPFWSLLKPSYQISSYAMINTKIVVFFPLIGRGRALVKE